MSQQQQQVNEQATIKLILDHQRLVSEHSALLAQSTNFISFLLGKLNSNSNETTNNEPKPSEDQTVRGSSESTEQ